MDQLNPFSDKICYYLNSGAVGDLTAASAVLNHAIKTFHEPRNIEYRVAIFDEFIDLFPQVPADKFISLDAAMRLQGYAIRPINALRPSIKNMAILTPSRLHLIQYASVNLLGRVLDVESTPYVPLEGADVAKFEIDFSKAVVIGVTYRDATRMWPGEEIIKTAKAIKDLGFNPVYVGKTGAMANWKNTLAKTEFEYPGFGTDLTNKTSLRELASVMARSRAVLGLDSGAMHIAMTTRVPVICGFTNVSPKLRFPYRKDCTSIPIEPDLACRFCQSDWNLDYCPRKEEFPPCTKEMTSDKFVRAFKRVVGLA